MSIPNLPPVERALHRQPLNDYRETHVRVQRYAVQIDFDQPESCATMDFLQPPRPLHYRLRTVAECEREECRVLRFQFGLSMMRFPSIPGISSTAIVLGHPNGLSFDCKQCGPNQVAESLFLRRDSRNTWAASRTVLTGFSRDEAIFNNFLHLPWSQLAAFSGGQLQIFAQSFGFDAARGDWGLELTGPISESLCNASGLCANRDGEKWRIRFRRP